MAGIQKYTSSLFVQSGSRAKFESGLEVTESVIIAGTVSASGYFDLDGNEITGGGVAEEFFAGSGSGVSSSTPSSVSTFVQLSTGETITSNIFIHTTHSNTFSPNYYNFVELTDEFLSVQSGSTSNYNVGSKSPGVYRYLVYGAQTGSSTAAGETHQVYTTVFVKGFFNEPPTLILPPAPTLSMAHDSTTGSIILHFTNSSDANSTDAIAYFTASRFSGSNPTSTFSQSGYTLVMSHSNFNGEAVHFSAGEILQTSSNVEVGNNNNGLNKNIGYTNTLFFTASISNYNITSNLGEIFYNNRFDKEKFTITLKDYNEVTTDGDSGVTTNDFILHIQSPPTASIQDIKINFEEDGFTGTPTSELTHTILYDRTSSLSSASIALLDPKYTSSLVRLNLTSKMNPPSGYTPGNNHTSKIRIFQSPNAYMTNSDPTLKYFTFKGGANTASLFGDSMADTPTLTESGKFNSFKFTPSFNNGPTESLFIGSYYHPSQTNQINNTSFVQYGNNNHYQAHQSAPNKVIFHKVPNIDITDIIIEVESGSFLTNTGSVQRTASLLYGYTSSLVSAQTKSLLVDLIPTGSENASIHPQFANYISSSIVRLRVRAKITEPFGPDHKPISFTLTGSNEDNSLQFSKLFTFSTHSGADCIISSSNYNSDPKQRLVGIYTSSWQEFNFPIGVYNFTTHLASSSNAGSNISFTNETAIVSMSNYGNVILSDLKYETEHSGLTGSGVNDANIVTSTTRSVLYGHEHSIFGVSSSYHDHPSSSLYASHSLFRMRVRGKITEPFGPATSKLNFKFQNKSIGATVPPLSALTNAFTINTTSSNVFINNQLVTVFTSSLIEKNITFGNVPSFKGPSKQTDYTISGSVTFDEDSTEEFIGTSNLSINNPAISQIAVIDTPATIIEDISYETETFGHSKIDSTNTTRSILYGDPHITNANSASAIWVNHPSASTYASHSVTRFRVKAKITEPIGFLVHSSSFENQWISSSQYSSSQLDFFTGSSAIEFSSSAYDTQGRLVVVYTSSFMGAILSSSNQNGVNYLFTSGNILHEPQGENGFTTESGISSNVLVKDTPATIIKVSTIQTETFGESNIPISNNNSSNPGIISRSILTGETTTRATGSGLIDSLTAGSVSRFRTLLKITEPLGFLHYSSSVTTKFHPFNGNQVSSEQLSPIQLFATNSQNTSSITSSFDGNTRFTNIYTSSFTGSKLASSIPGFYSASSIIEHNPPGENGSVITLDNSTLFFKVIGADNSYKINNTTIEVESSSFETNVGTSSLNTSLLYGLTSSLLFSETSSKIKNILYNNENHPNYLSYISQSIVRFRITTKIIEPFGIQEHQNIAISLTTGSNSNPILSSNDLPTFNFNTASIGSNILSSSAIEIIDGVPKLVAKYTSSFVEVRIPSGTFIFSSSVSSNYNFFTVDSVTTASVNMEGVAPTEFKNLTYTTETHGHSGIEVPSTTRTVLYGDPHITNANSSSTVWVNHPSASTYTSHSITRVKVKGLMIEPFGPGTISSSVIFNINRSGYNDFKFSSSKIIPNTSGSYNNKQLNTTFNLPFEGTSIELIPEDYGTTKTFAVSGNIQYKNPINSNSFIISNDTTFGEIEVKDTPPTQIENIIYETETHGHSGVASTSTTRSILYGNPHITNKTSASAVWENHNKTLIYASHSVTRFRIRAKITEPLGYLLHSSSFESKWISNELNSSSLLDFSTNSDGIKTSSSIYDSQDRLITTYTSSFVGAILSSSNINGVNYLFTSGNILHEPSGENGFTTSSHISSNILVKDTPPTQIQDIKYETETFGGSKIFSTSTTRSVLYGDPHITNATSSGTTWVNHPSASSYTSHSVTRFRIRAKVIEPLGFLIFTSSFEENISSTQQGYETSSLLNFFSGSSNVENVSIYDPQNRLVTDYTTSFHGHILSSSNINGVSYLFTSGNILHEPPGENKFTTESGISSNILVKDTPQVIIEKFHEYEEFGYSASNASDSGVLSTTRTVLYGDAFITNDGTGSEDTGNSWANHPSASIYASHSVTRMRLRTKITEPLGYAHATITFGKFLSTISLGLIKAFAGSSDFEASSSIYDSSDRLVIAYTESWRGKDVELDITNRGNEGSQDYAFNSTTITNIVEENGIDILVNPSILTVKNTPPVQIKINKIEIGSGLIADGNAEFDNDNNDPTITKHIFFNNPTTIGNTALFGELPLIPNLFESTTLTRFRILANITEPLGYAHYSTNISYTSQNHNNSGVEGDIINFSTHSGTNCIASSSVYDENIRLISTYTSSFIGETLASSSPNFYQFYIQNSNIVLNDNNTEPDFNRVDNINDSKLFFKVNNNTNDPLQINDIVVEVESSSFSNVGQQNFTSSLLYGLTSSLLSHQTQSIIVDQVDSNTPQFIVNNYKSSSLIRLRIKAKITEPYGSDIQTVTSSFKHLNTSPFEKSSPKFAFGEGQNQSGSILVISSSVISTNFNDNLPRIINRYTSSWVDLQFPSGEFYLFSQFESSSDNSVFEPNISIVDFSTSQSANVSMSNTPSTQLIDLTYETETHGHSGISTTESIRRILYGDSHVTNATSESAVWEDHDNTLIYGSQSVSRFRVKGKIIEPFGPANSTFNLNLIVSSSGNPNTNIITKATFISLNTVDTNPAINYNDNSQLVTLFTSSFSNDVNVTVTNTNTPQLSENFIISGNIVNYDVVSPHEPNTLEISTPITTSLTITDTDATRITISKIETETFGESNIGISNPNENTPGIISRSILFNETTTENTGSGVVNAFTSSVVTRFRISANIIEPLGFLHHPTDISLRFNSKGTNGNSDVTSGFTQIFTTSSNNLFANSSSVYDVQKRLNSSYTSKFLGLSLGASSGSDGVGYWEATASNVNHSPNGENSNTVTSSNSHLYFVVSQSFADITKPTISNFKLEVEKTKSGSGEGNSIRHTNILHGLAVTETDNVKNSEYNYLTSDEQLVSIRVLANVEELPGNEHNPVTIKIGGHSGPPFSITFDTSSESFISSNVDELSSTQGLLAKYTSSFFPIGLSASGFTNGGQEERREYIVSASITSITNVTDFDLIPAVISHSVIHVTGALSSSTAITIVTGSSLSSSVFKTGEEKSVYFVYTSSQAFNQISETIGSTLITTPPLFTTESNLVFSRNLSVNNTISPSGVPYIAYFDSLTDLSNSGLSNDVQFDGGISTSFPEYGIFSLTEPKKITFTTTVTNNEIGNGVNQKSLDIFIIPTEPGAEVGTFHKINFHQHPPSMKDKLYFGLLAADSFTHYSNSIAPINSQTRIVSSSEILNVSTSNNYSMSFSTPPSFTGNHLTTDRAFGFGDKGTLVVKINDITVVNANLETNFNSSLKSASQDLSGYVDGGFTNGTASFNSSIDSSYNDKGFLILNKIAPFNGVSQSISASGIAFPNGYQAYSASLFINEKLRDGYNSVEFMHNVTSNITHSLNKINFYYNDGPTTASVKPNSVLSFENSSTTISTHSLSGVSYFREGIQFSSSLSASITNLANKIYSHDLISGTPSNVPILITSKSLGDTELAILGDGVNENPINHTPSDIGSATSRRGLRFHENDNNYIPTNLSTASVNIGIEISNGNLPNNIDPIQGKSYNLSFSQKIRNISSEHSYNSTPVELIKLPIGRFMKSGSNLQSMTNIDDYALNIFTASFFSEDLRWSSSSMEQKSISSSTELGVTNFKDFWLSSQSADYNSNQNITDTQDLQQLYTGELIFPYINYSGSNPNSVNYSTINKNQKRYYYRAVSSSRAEGKQFTMIISGSDISLLDFPKGIDVETGQNPTFNKGNFNIFAKIPGPIRLSPTNNASNPGSGWGVVTGGGGLANNTFQNNFNMGSSIDTTLTDIDNGKIAIKFDFGNRDIKQSKGIILLRVGISGSFSGSRSIKQITIQEQ